MNKDKYVFAQMTEYLDYLRFRRLVRKYRGDSYVKRFTCWNQLLTLAQGTPSCPGSSIKNVSLLILTGH